MQKDNSWKEACLNPEFKKKFETDYMFEEVQNFRFQVKKKFETDYMFEEVQNFRFQEVQNFRFQLYDIDNHKDHSVGAPTPLNRNP
ncbi:hypothetical protein T484DRAFT_1811406 [Baffinella frigidus]|nr:hypothetical protein T484DRAFT_1811406 [Cryptophyta sp. CCMP2293]